MGTTISIIFKVSVEFLTELSMEWSLLLKYSRGLDLYKDIDVIFVSL